MSNLQSDLIIHDEEYYSFGELMDVMNNNAEGRLEYLVHQLEYVNTEGIISAENVKENLNAYTEKLKAMLGQFKIFTEAYAREASDFIKDVEYYDCNFYNGGM